MASQDFSLWHETIKACLTLLVSSLTLLLGWLFGQRLGYHWNIRQKRREIQLAVSQQFYLAYGEFFAVWKLWNRLDRNNPSFDDRRWGLHQRAAAAEAIVEGLMVKLSSELVLDSSRLRMLGCFRQAVQQLRQSIREDVVLNWLSSGSTCYVTFKELASSVATILSSEWPEDLPSARLASSQLLEITANKWEPIWFDWTAQEANQGQR